MREKRLRQNDGDEDDAGGKTIGGMAIGRVFSIAITIDLDAYLYVSS